MHLPLDTQESSLPLLETRRLRLRAPELEDLEILYAWENHTQTWQISNTLVPFSRFILRQYLETAGKEIFETKQLRLMIDLKSEKGLDLPIGTIDLFDFDPLHQRAGIGILVAAPKNRRKGYASEALSALTRYAFEILQLKQLYCNILENNPASLELFQKAGFEITGIKKNWIRTGNEWLDEYLLQLQRP